jgi:RNA polymerase sigma-70 factor (ECF subfamily)
VTSVGYVARVPDGVPGDLESRIADALDAGDARGACEQALRGYGHELLRYARVLCPDGDDADEVFARTCDKVWRALAGFRRECSFRTWVYKIAWHAAKDVRREHARRRVRRLLTGEVSKLAQEIRSATAAHHRTETRDRLAKLRASLDPEEQNLLTLRLEAGLAWSEIAAVLADGADQAALRKRYERLKSKLRRLAEAEGLLSP